MTEKRGKIITVLALGGIVAHLVLRFGFHTSSVTTNIPLWIVLAGGGAPLVFSLFLKMLKKEFGSDLLAAFSIVTAVLLGEYLAGSLVVLMLSGGELLENYAVANASSVLRALAKRMPSIAHRKDGDRISDIPIDSITPGDTLLVYPHEICPVDGTVLEGHGVMDESFLTGEPFRISKAPGVSVISGAVNGETALTITATRRAVDSRYAKIMEVMRQSEKNRPRLRRLGDLLGAWYTPISVSIAVLAWIVSGDPVRFLAVLVVATPCPLLIAIPVAIIGSISLAARRAIVIKNPIVLEQIDRCRTAIFDKTGTLTYGEPKLTGISKAPGYDSQHLLLMAASLERYSKHPLARAILDAAAQKSLKLPEATRVTEPPGQGLSGIVAGQNIELTNRKKLLARDPAAERQLPSLSDGLEAIILVDGAYAGMFKFHDAPRSESSAFISHLRPRHAFDRLMIVSGDRESEVRYLAEEVGIREIHAQQSPEEKVEIVKRETSRAKTLYVGDGINDAPAMTVATVAVAIGSSDITAEAAGAVLLESSLKKVDELMHISRRMRQIALQSAVGGMCLSVGGMLFAASGALTPVMGAVAQEVIDVLAVLNALRTAWPPRSLTDF